MTEELANELEKIGLTKGEARVYIALLNTGASTVSPIVKESKLAYSKIYEVLDRLIEKGLASFIIKQKTRYYQAIAPKRLEEYIEKKEKELKDKKAILERIIPRLSNIKSDDENNTQLFLGENGVLSAYEILINNAKKDSTIRFFYMYKEDYNENAKKFYANSPKLKEIMKINFTKNNVCWKAITNKPIEKIKVKKYMDEKYINYPVPGNIDITEDYVLITEWGKKPVAILIKSKEISKNYIDYFDAMWKIAKKN